jgi:glycosyltransferase involved in cell wall biosynthesis
MGDSQNQTAEKQGPRKRILLGALSFGASIGGGDISSTLVAQMLQSEYDVSVLTGANGSSHPQVYELRLGPLRAAVPMLLRLPMRATGISRQVENVLRTVQPALIHLQDMHLIDPVVPIARRLGVPVIVTLRNVFFVPSFRRKTRAGKRSLPVSPTVRGSAFLELLRWSRPLSWPLPLLLPWLYAKPARVRKLMGQATLLLPVSDYLKAEIAACGIQTPCEVLMLIPVPDWPLQPPRHARNVRFLSIGRLVDRKGTDVLIRAFRRVLADLPEAELLIAGDGPQRVKLEQLAKRAGCSSRIQFLGFVAHDQTHRLYEQADIVVFPSTFPEASGRVAVEAGLVGRPVIASRIGGLPEIIGTQCGVLVAPGNEEELAAQMLALASDPERQERIVRAAREQAEQFTFANLREKLLDVYQRVLAGKIPAG